MCRQAANRRQASIITRWPIDVRLDVDVRVGQGVAHAGLCRQVDDPVDVGPRVDSGEDRLAVGEIRPDEREKPARASS